MQPNHQKSINVVMVDFRENAGKDEETSEGRVGSVAVVTCGGDLLGNHRTRHDVISDVTICVTRIVHRKAFCGIFFCYREPVRKRVGSE
ncbi:hypothetical protein DPMN_124294 [Dreissena polymorpha]|uniref:Uncharacterized protein n=1 Tax=Dreissena polymorpha TaxID=45954 RepID=A0A9D4JW17_DREPO|nr:hypothetical protein DPMN_124294 [Dreissena polymorpha]